MEKHVVYSGSKNLYPWMVGAAKSVWANSSIDKIHFLIEDPEFPYELPEFIETTDISEMAKERFPDDGANIRTKFTRMALFRVCYGSLFPDIEAIFQLDVDTIVLDDIGALWETFDFDKDWWLAAVHEKFGTVRTWGRRYYNIGAALFNLRQIREDGIEETLVDFLNLTEVPYIDQDAWNKYAPSNRKDILLDTRYNETFVTGYTPTPAVVHYAGYSSWMDNLHVPRREYLYKYLNMPWDEVMKHHEDLLKSK